MWKKCLPAIVRNFEIYSHIVKQKMILIYQSFEQKVHSFSPYIIFPFPFCYKSLKRKYGNYITIILQFLLVILACLFSLTTRYILLKQQSFLYFHIVLPSFFSMNYFHGGFMSVLSQLVFIYSSETYMSRIYSYYKCLYSVLI